MGQYNDGALVSALADGALLVARIRRTTSSALRRAVQTLKGASATLIGTVASFEPGHRSQLNRSKPAGPQPPAPKAPASGATEKITTANADAEGLVNSAGAQRIPPPRHGSG